MHPDERSFFACCNCGRPVNPVPLNTLHRNHCPHCLWSLHIDLRPGDRMSFCRGKMQPVAIWVKDNGEWALLHRCTNCGVIKPNRIAGDDNEELLNDLAVKLLKQQKPMDRIKAGQ
jgi:ribosome biogenesis GTPase / thiamine phosphate phosphatase